MSTYYEFISVVIFSFMFKQKLISKAEILLTHICQKI